MTALDSAIALLETERADLAARLASVDTAIASLRALDTQAVAVPPAGPPAMPVRTVPLHPGEPEPRKTADLPDPRPPARRPRQRMFTAAQKRAGADLGRDIGVSEAAHQLDVDTQTIEAWMRWFPAATPAGEKAAAEPPAPDDDPDDIPAGDPPRAALAAVPTPWGACSCGERFDSREEWGRHNGQITERATGTADIAAHRLTVHYGIPR